MNAPPLARDREGMPTRSPTPPLPASATVADGCPGAAPAPRVPSSRCHRPRRRHPNTRRGRRPAMILHRLLEPRRVCCVMRFHRPTSAPRCDKRWPSTTDHDLPPTTPTSPCEIGRAVDNGNFVRRSRARFRTKSSRSRGFRHEVSSRLRHEVVDFVTKSWTLCEIKLTN